MSPSRLSISENRVSLYCVLSLPRSGSTVLTSQLDDIRGVVCVPENYFPCLLAFIVNWDCYSEQRLADLFFAATDDKNLLTKQEIVSCFDVHDMRKTYIAIGLKIAEKMGRNVNDVHAVVWKTTRLISGFTLLRKAGFRFILLKRNLLNVLDSQYRVDFGRNNRRPLRFVLFAYSYQAVFRNLSNSDTFFIEYSQIQNKMPELLNWMGLGNEKWTQGSSAVLASMSSSKWHAGLSKSFIDNDSEKLRDLSWILKFEFFVFSVLFYPLAFILRPLRFYLDSITAKKITLKS